MRIDKALESALAAAHAAPQVAKLRKATQGVEQIFLKQLLSQMRQSSLNGEESYGMGMYKDMMDDALAGAVSKRGDFGVAKQLQGQLEPILMQQELGRIRLLAAERIRAHETRSPNSDKEQP